MSGKDPVYKVLKAVWKHGFVHGTGLLGIVAIETGIEDQWKAYIGYIPMTTGDELKDERLIAEWGAKLEKSEAMGFFPGFDADKFVY